VRDVAAHLLDTALRKLSLVRDGCFMEKVEIRSAEDVVTLVNRLNREGVAVYRRLSPAVLCRLMAAACEESASFHESLDPFAAATFPVSWAGEETSANWFDTARELTERWHHQQQIRQATERPGIMTPELYHPVLDCFLRGLPYTYRNVEAVQGTAVRAEIAGECGGQWQIRRGSSGWVLETPRGDWNARVTIPQEIAWRVFTKGIGRADALEQVRIEGDRKLALPALGLTAIVG
ncbi:MAG TPA: maleylpyruvate isomerase N-terminal domain-containing protein, partial [Bryobacteraceae bacterium]